MKQRGCLRHRHLHRFLGQLAELPLPTSRSQTVSRQVKQLREGNRQSRSLYQVETPRFCAVESHPPDPSSGSASRLHPRSIYRNLRRSVEPMLLEPAGRKAIQGDIRSSALARRNPVFRGIDPVPKLSRLCFVLHMQDKKHPQYRFRQLTLQAFFPISTHFPMIWSKAAAIAN